MIGNLHVWTQKKADQKRETIKSEPLSITKRKIWIREDFGKTTILAGK